MNSPQLLHTIHVEDMFVKTNRENIIVIRLGCQFIDTKQKVVYRAKNRNEFLRIQKFLRSSPNCEYTES